MGGRICRICASNQLSAQVGALIAEGLPDQKIADAIGIPSKAGRMVVNRHRHAHVEAPARAIVEAASKGQDAIKARKEMVAAAIGGDAAAAFLSLGHITTDLRRVQERLERTADAAEHGGQRLAVASLSGQQLRATEVRARLGGIGGFTPQKSENGGAASPIFAINFHFSRGAEQLVLSNVTGSSLPALDMAALPHDPPQAAISITGNDGFDPADTGEDDEFDEDV